MAVDIIPVNLVPVFLIAVFHIVEHQNLRVPTSEYGFGEMFANEKNSRRALIQTCVSLHPYRVENTFLIFRWTEKSKGKKSQNLLLISGIENVFEILVFVLVYLSNNHSFHLTLNCSVFSFLTNCVR